MIASFITTALPPNTACTVVSAATTEKSDEDAGIRRALEGIGTVVVESNGRSQESGADMRTTTGSIFSGVVGRSAHARAPREPSRRALCAKRFAAIYLSEQGALMSTADTASLPSWVDDQCTTAMGYLSSDAASSSSDFGGVDDEEGMSFSAMCAAEEALAGARAADALNAAVVAAAEKRRTIDQAQIITQGEVAHRAVASPPCS